MNVKAKKPKTKGGDGIVSRNPFTPWMLLSPGLIWLALFFVVPMIFLGKASLEDGGFSNYTSVLSENSETITRTFVYALFTTVIALGAGYPLAYFIAVRARRFKSLLLAGVVLPFFVTYLIRTIAWKVLFFGEGPITMFAKNVGIISEHGEILNTPFAVVGALVYNYLPFMVLPIYVSLEKIDKRLLEAAPDLYASGFKTFIKVTLPLSLPGVFAGSLLTFIPTCGDFVNAELLGGDGQRMIGNVIEKNFLQPVFRPQMSALSFILMLLILGGVLLYAKLLGTEDLA